MKIAVSAENNLGGESTVSHHFGRCPYFALVEVNGDQVLSISMINNPYYETHQPGQVPDFIKDQDAEVMISGGMGKRAQEFFNQAGIKIATGASGSVLDAVNAYFSGELRGTVSCGGGKHHGHNHDHSCH